MTFNPAVLRTLSTAAAGFIESVLRLRPRVAAFDCDGTLWSPDAGEQFFYWEMKQHLVPQAIARWAVPRYTDYRAGRVGESQMCGEMVTLHAGLDVATIQAAAEEFFREHIDPYLFPAMQELIRRLNDAGCEIWAVSSTNEWVIRAAAARFGFAEDRILAAAAVIENGRVTDRLIRVPTDGAKATVLQQVLAEPPDAVFGNSMHDLAMLEYARNAFVVNPNADLKTVARAKNWTVYQP